MSELALTLPRAATRRRYRRPKPPSKAQLVIVITLYGYTAAAVAFGLLGLVARGHEGTPEAVTCWLASAGACGFVVRLGWMARQVWHLLRDAPVSEKLWRDSIWFGWLTTAFLWTAVIVAAVDL